MEMHMKFGNTIRVLGMLTVAGALSAPAAAEDAGWYLGGNIGKTVAEIDDERINNSLIAAGFTNISIADDDKDTGYKLFGGYQFNKTFALEGGYFDLGEHGYTATTVPTGSVNGRLETKGLNLDLVAMHNFSEKFAAFGRVGANYAQTDATFSDTGAAHVLKPGRDESDLNYKYGIGLQYALTPSWGLRFEAERYRINDAVGNTGDIDMASIGLVYRFGQDTKKTVMAPPPAEPAKMAAPVVAVAPVVEMEKYCTILNLEFNINESGVELDDKEKLGVVGTFLNKYPKTTAVIGGYSDNVGASDDNLKLSQTRAQSVVDFIVTQYNIDRKRVKAIGYGEGRPIETNATAEGQRANRRVSAVISCADDIEGLTPVAARITMAMQMEFDSDQATVKPQYRNQLEAVANYLHAHPEADAAIQGHSSDKNRVSAAASMEVSKRRAENVANYLVANFGIPRSRLTTEGFGETDRFAYNSTAAGQQDNQRVNIIFTYKR